MLEIIRNLFNKDDHQAFSCCRHIMGGITFMHNAFRVCCSNKEGITFAENYKGEKINWKKIRKERKKIIENCKNGILPEKCKGCVDLATRVWDDNNLIDNIYINHWDHCNCACVYCLADSHSQFLQKTSKPSRYYNVYEHLKQLYKNKMISPDVFVEMVGGDLTVLDEADDIINLCLDNGVGVMSFHSSCIFYSKGIERAIKEAPLVIFDFSLDCGNRELYKKIKRIDAFDDVIANLKRYMACSENSKESLVAKYIIVDGYNDNIEALEEWLQLINSLGIKKAKVDIDFKRFFPEFHHPDPTVPKHYYDLYDHFYKRIKELGIEDNCWEYSKQVMAQGGIPKD